MRKVNVIVAFVAFGPLAASAEPPVREFVAFRFKATVTSVETLNDDDFLNRYKPGDPWDGELRVLRFLAPTDSSPDPNIGTYVGGHFIVGRAPGRRGVDLDRVEIRDGVNGVDSFDGTSSYAWYQLFDGQEYRTTIDTSLRVESSVFDFIEGDALLQEFDFSGGGIGEGVFSSMHRPTDDSNPVLGGIVNFVINAFRARPGRCSVP